MPNDYAWVKSTERRITKAIETKLLSEGGLIFLHKMLTRLERYGVDAYISSGQHQGILKILAKVEAQTKDRKDIYAPTTTLALQPGTLKLTEPINSLIDEALVDSFPSAKSMQPIADAPRANITSLAPKLTTISLERPKAPKDPGVFLAEVRKRTEERNALRRRQEKKMIKIIFGKRYSKLAENISQSDLLDHSSPD